MYMCPLRTDISLVFPSQQTYSHSSNYLVKERNLFHRSQLVQFGKGSSFIDEEHETHHWDTRDAAEVQELVELGVGERSGHRGRNKGTVGLE